METLAHGEYSANRRGRSGLRYRAGTHQRMEPIAPARWGTLESQAHTGLPSPCPHLPYPPPPPPPPSRILLFLPLPPPSSSST
eukprot:8097967-Pyramimonas_sp.AAC.1